MNCATAWSAARALALAAIAVSCAPAAQAAITCGFLSSSSTAFDVYDVASSAPTDTVALIQVRCESDSGSNPNISLTVGIGPGAGGSVNNRRMQLVGGTDLLYYGLFRDSGRSAVWGYTPGVDAMTQPAKVQNGRRVDTTFTVYGRIRARQDVTPGSYVDTVQVTLSP